MEHQIQRGDTPGASLCYFFPAALHSPTMPSLTHHPVVSTAGCAAEDSTFSVCLHSLSRPQSTPKRLGLTLSNVWNFLFLSTTLHSPTVLSLTHHPLIGATCRRCLLRSLLPQSYATTTIAATTSIHEDGAAPPVDGFDASTA